MRECVWSVAAVFAPAVVVAVLDVVALNVPVRLAEVLATSYTFSLIRATGMIRGDWFRKGRGGGALLDVAYGFAGTVDELANEGCEGQRGGDCVREARKLEFETWHK